MLFRPLMRCVGEDCVLVLSEYACADESAMDADARSLTSATMRAARSVGDRRFNAARIYRAVAPNHLEPFMQGPKKTTNKTNTTWTVIKH